MKSELDIQKRLEAIGLAPAYAEWLLKVTDPVFDRDQKNALVSEVRATIADVLKGSTADAVSQLQKAAVRQLFRVASERTSKRVHIVGQDAPIHSQSEIEAVVTSRFPYPIAHSYRQLTRAGSESAASAYGWLVVTLESFLHYFLTVLFSAYLRDKAPSTDLNRRLLGKLYQQTWGTGDLMELVRETARLYFSKPDALPYPQLVPYLFAKRNKFTPHVDALHRLVEFRTLYWGHTVYPDEGAFRQMLGAHRLILEGELNHCAWLGDLRLYIPREVRSDGRVIIADSLNGANIVADQQFTLRIDPAALQENGGEIKLGETLIIQGPSDNEYLPLYPLSVFRFQLNQEAPFFLRNREWASKASRLKRLHYVAYGSPNSYMANPDELAVRSLQSKVHFLEDALKAAGVSLENLKATVPESLNYDIPEVWTQETMHLATFVGRAPILERMKDWSKKGTGYLLLLGGPGQGKSALMAQFANGLLLASSGSNPGVDSDLVQLSVRHPNSSKIPCLFHMIRSHKDPASFLRFLLWQAELLSGAPPNPHVYSGSVDDLRSALLTALQGLRKRFGRSLVVIDALDELERPEEQIQFLPEILPEGIGIAISARPEIPLIQTLRNRLRTLTILEVPSLSPVDLPPFAERHFGSELARELASIIDFKALFDHTQGNPLIIWSALRSVVSRIGESRDAGRPLRVIETRSLPNTTDGAFAVIYDRITGTIGDAKRSGGEGLKVRIVQFLAIATQPLSMEDLRLLLREDRRASSKGELVSLEQLRNVLRRMSSYLLTHDEEHFQLFHRGFVDFVTTQILGAEGSKEAHEVFCKWLMSDRLQASHYRLRHLPYHLYAAGLHVELESLLLGSQFTAAVRAQLNDAAVPSVHMRCLTMAYLAANRDNDVVALAITDEGHQRDGVISALKAEAFHRNTQIASITDQLLKVASSSPTKGSTKGLPTSILNARRAGIEAARHQGNAEALGRVALDPDADVRAILVPYLYEFWQTHRDEGWTLLNRLMNKIRLSHPLQAQRLLESCGGVALIILTDYYDDPITMDLLQQQWQSSMRRVFHIPLQSGRVRKRLIRLLLGVGVSTLTAVLSKFLTIQPSSQTNNLKELEESFNTTSAERQRTLTLLKEMENPAALYEPIEEIVMNTFEHPDEYFMIVLIWTLFLKGSRDPGGLIRSLDRMYREGPPWTHKSNFTGYTAFQPLLSAGQLTDECLDTYARFAIEGIKEHHATFQTWKNTYSLHPNIAYLEVAFDIHRPSGRSRFAAALFEDAVACGDVDYAKRVIDGCGTLSLVYHRHQLALDALRSCSALQDSTVRGAVVRVLASMRFNREDLVGEFLKNECPEDLAVEVRSTIPTVRFVDMSQSFDNYLFHIFVRSDPFRAKFIEAMRDRGHAKNLTEWLQHVMRSGINVLLGETILPV